MKTRSVSSVAKKAVTMLLAIVMLIGSCPVLIHHEADASAMGQGALSLVVYPYTNSGATKGDPQSADHFQANIYVTKDGDINQTKSVCGFDVEATHSAGYEVRVWASVNDSSLVYVDADANSPDLREQATLAYTEIFQYNPIQIMRVGGISHEENATNIKPYPRRAAGVFRNRERVGKNQ